MNFGFTVVWNNVTGRTATVIYGAIAIQKYAMPWPSNPCIVMAAYCKDLQSRAPDPILLSTVGHWARSNHNGVCLDIPHPQRAV